ncbi:MULTISPECIES: hypothetical protein [Streptomyces]|uniref:hypothetical protein n=1 Tax=Streptomyces TaxID=1883 RepID=UPI0004C65D6F|nr:MULTISPECIES: hypothetical protein [Streptomyces]KOU96288.1 hypothetical protein ADK93_04310 [Streptomyces sp. XY58]KOV11857.1 hypothetical protein ADK89_03695 [Streptomyces sp. XY37]KOV55047.1 hypothetical protein ADK99_04830 [Streptomyces sp. MMG1064]
MTTDAGQVPATPLYTITLTGSGVSIDGEPVGVPAGDLPAARLAALAEIRVRAALRGRPVRVTAKEPDGSAWPLVVDPDGHVTTLSVPHPVVPPPVRAGDGSGRSAAPVAPAVPFVPEPAVTWGAPLPAAHQEAWARLLAAHGAGDTTTAIALAERTEAALEAEYGPLHPYTVQVLSARAWLVLGRRDDLSATVRLLVRTALRRRRAGAEPRSETAQVAGNAHAAWRSLAATDSRRALELSGPLTDMLEELGWPGHTQDVVHWVEETTRQRTLTEDPASPEGRT